MKFYRLGQVFVGMRTLGDMDPSAQQEHVRGGMRIHGIIDQEHYSMDFAQLCFSASQYHEYE